MTYKIFEAGETLSANDVMTYFMNQVVTQEATFADLSELSADIKTAWVAEDDSLYIRSTAGAWEKIALVDDIQSAINDLLDGAPDALNTLNELAEAIQGTEGGLSAFVTKGTFTTVGDLLYASDVSTPVRLGIGTEDQVLAVSNAGIPEWTTLPSGYSLPSQTGNSGKYLSTDGTNESWETVTTYSAPTLGTTVIGSGATVTTIADLNTDYPTLKAPTEIANIVASGATGTINIDLDTSSVWYYTANATGNHTLNFRFDSSTSLDSKLSVGEAASFVWLNTNGSTAYYPNVIQIDGVTQTVKWSGGAGPTSGNASAIDAYSFTIIKTGVTPTYLVIGGQVKLA